MYRHLLIVAALLVVTSSPVLAEEPAALSSHQQAARELYLLAGGEQMAFAGADAMLEIVRSNPEIAPYEDVFQTWFRNVFASGDFEAQIIDLYVNVFTEQELQELITFYQSPLGQKILAQLPQIMQQAMELGTKLGQEHLPELQAMILQAKQEREGGTGTEP